MLHSTEYRSGSKIRAVRRVGTGRRRRPVWRTINFSHTNDDPLSILCPCFLMLLSPSEANSKIYVSLDEKLVVGLSTPGRTYTPSDLLSRFSSFLVWEINMDGHIRINYAALARNMTGSGVLKYPQAILKHRDNDYVNRHSTMTWAGVLPRFLWFATSYFVR